jgi:hypothetical protein
VLIEEQGADRPLHLPRAYSILWTQSRSQYARPIMECCPARHRTLALNRRLTGELPPARRRWGDLEHPVAQQVPQLGPMQDIEHRIAG